MGSLKVFCDITKVLPPSSTVPGPAKFSCVYQVMHDEVCICHSHALTCAAIALAMMDEDLFCSGNSHEEVQEEIHLMGCKMLFRGGRMPEIISVIFLFKKW